ncbi:type II toxin-antitoxin system RelE/ParE family toxin [Telmatobacter bradus]|uniref:type II toxin-antitoxin system RelE/ParE family toxin n=1 Tax=Telmatobacter bradus TaxID=474953 RepID=UPI003B43C79C
MKVFWSPLAIEDLEAIHAYIAEENPSAARKIAQIICSAAEKLADFPELGRAGRVTGTRELVVAGTAYIVVYARVENELWLVNVLHGRR